MAYFNAKLIELNGAGEGNRTLVFDLEGRRSTIELHPHFVICPNRGIFSGVPDRFLANYIEPPLRHVAPLAH